MLDYFTYLDETNSAFGTAIQLTNLGPLGPNAFSQSASDSGIVFIGGSYSLTQVITIAHTGVGTTSFDATLNGAGQVPEPSTIALLGLGLAGIGFSRKRKQAA